jgi:hypothetical protein
MKFWYEHLKERDHLEDPNTHQILIWILKKSWRVWTGLIWLRVMTSEHGNKSSGTVECWEWKSRLIESLVKTYFIKNTVSTFIIL